MNTYQAKIGYARTSTVDQNLDTQIKALTAAGCGMVRQEQRSGVTLDDRPELQTSVSGSGENSDGSSNGTTVDLAMVAYPFSLRLTAFFNTAMI